MHVDKLRGREEGTCLFDNTIIDNNYLCSTKNSQETVAEAAIATATEIMII